MPNSIASLFALQDLDVALDAHRAGIQTATAELEDDSALTESQSTLAEATEALAEASKGQREREFEVDDLKAKLEPAEKKLYDGSITSPKELQELEHQVTTFKDQLAVLEATLLDQIGEAETASSAVMSAESDIAEIEARRATDHERLRREIAEHERAAADLDAKRTAAAALIDAAMLRVYEQLRPRTGGRPVARVERGMCGGCRIGLPVSIVSRARAATTLVQCTSCQRILLGG